MLKFNLGMLFIAVISFLATYAIDALNAPSNIAVIAGLVFFLLMLNVLWFLIRNQIKTGSDTENPKEV